MQFVMKETLGNYNENETLIFMYVNNVILSNVFHAAVVTVGFHMDLVTKLVP